MNNPAEDPLLLTKVLASKGRAARIPSVLLDKVPPRLRVVAILNITVNLIFWVGVNLFEGEFLSEFDSLSNWVSPILAVTASLLIVWMSRGHWTSTSQLATIGLFYLVLVSYCIAVSSYWTAFHGLSADQLTGDRVGVAFVALWMLAYAALIPARIRSLATALVASASAIPVIYALNVRLGIAPELAPSQFFLIFVLPYLGIVVFSLVIARTLHNLGRDVARAREIGSYRLTERIGTGGMGEVWRADHSMLARPAAVKLIQPESLGDDSSSTVMARFEREAQITAALESPHSIQLYDFGTTGDGRLYYVMELLDGVDLQAMVRRFGPLPAERVIPILRQACDSLEEAHRHGLVHRDIKPANIFLSRWALEFDFVKVLDFGLAKHRSADLHEKSEPLTRADTIMGTPAFLAPEIALGAQQPDGRADLYALGCVGYWLLTGRVVFDADSPVAMVVAHVKTAPPPLSDRVEGELPMGLEQVLLDCLAKDPAERPQSASELATRLDALRPARPWTSERAERWWTRADWQS